MYICICKSVRESDIQVAVEMGACSMSDLKECTGLASQCGKCAREAKAIFKDAKRQTESNSELAFPI